MYLMKVIELLLLMLFYVPDVVSVVICACKHLSIHILGNQGFKMGFWMKKSQKIRRFLCCPEDASLKRAFIVVAQIFQNMRRLSERPVA